MSDRVIAALQKHIAKRRAFIKDRFPKHLNQTDYLGLCGMHQEVEDLDDVLQAAIRLDNAPEPSEADDSKPLDPDKPVRVGVPSTRVKTIRRPT